MRHGRRDQNVDRTSRWTSELGPLLQLGLLGSDLLRVELPVFVDREASVLGTI